MNKTIQVPVWLVVVIVIGMACSSVRLFAGEPHRERCAEGPTMTGPVNPVCPLVSRPRFRLR